MVSIIPNFISRLFQGQGQVLSWVWVPDDHAVTSDVQPLQAPTDFVAGDDYVVFRLAEMYLRVTRVLWKEFYPLVHSFVAYGDSAAPHSTAAIAGPGQLKDLGTENLDRLIGLSYRLAGPLVYDGQDIELLAGLYAVPAKDGAKVLIDTLGQLSGLVPALKEATDIANIVKGGVEGLLGISGTRLALGIHDTVRSQGTNGARAARPGYVAAINAPASTIKPEELWIRGGRLYEGRSPIAARPFNSYDMMLFELHRGPSRVSNWATLPQVAPHVSEFDTLLKSEATVQDLKAKLNKAYREFENDLNRNDDLTKPDKAAIRALVAEDLKQRVAKIDGGGLFETRSVAGAERRVDIRSFSAMDIPDVPAGATLPSRDERTPLFP